jgi:hypothetical protein
MPASRSRILARWLARVLRLKQCACIEAVVLGSHGLACVLLLLCYAG